MQEANGSVKVTMGNLYTGGDYSEVMSSCRGESLCGEGEGSGLISPMRGGRRADMARLSGSPAQRASVTPEVKRLCMLLLWKEKNNITNNNIGEYCLMYIVELKPVVCNIFVA
jgi:hypothetical protein